MERHVLVGFDESGLSTAALEHALSAFPDGRVTVLHVADAEDSRQVRDEHEADAADLHERTRERSDRVLDDARDVAAARDREIETAVRSGDPVTEIVECAGQSDVDHVVVGSHGRDGIKRLFLGSVAENVVRRSPVPVTVYRPGVEE